MLKDQDRYIHDDMTSNARKIQAQIDQREKEGKRWATRICE